MRFHAMLAAMAIGVAALAAGSGSAAPPPTETVDPAKLPFQVTVPPGLRVEELRGPDFLVFYFNQGDQTYAGAYLGFAPSYKGDRPKTHNGISQLVRCENGRPVEREALFYIGDAGRDDYIHAWTAPVPGQDISESESILLSIRVPGVNDGLTRDKLKAC